MYKMAIYAGLRSHPAGWVRGTKAGLRSHPAGWVLDTRGYLASIYKYLCMLVPPLLEEDDYRLRVHLSSVLYKDSLFSKCGVNYIAAKEE